MRRHVAFTLVWTLIALNEAPAQRLTSPLVSRSAPLSAAPYSQSSQQGGGESCVGRRIAFVALNTLGGAAFGWVAFTFGLGLFASDHGEVYERERHKWVVGGAIFGAAVGVWRVIRTSCGELIRPR